MEITNNKYNTMPEQVQENKDNIKILSDKIKNINDFNFTGAWVSQNDYKVNDIVTYNNAIYVVIQDINDSIIPPTQDIQHFYLAIEAPHGSNPNVLINGDFRVNQRGESVYTTGFTVDRWRISTECTITPLSNGGVNILTTGNANALFYRFEEEDFENIRGKICTLSMKCNTIKIGKIDVQMGDTTIGWNYQNTSQGLTENGIFVISFKIPENATPTTKVVIHTTGATNANVEWVKLELGAFATEFTPKSYAEELAMCQRYYEKIDSENNAMNKYQIYAYARTNYTLYTPQISFGVSKRVPPTVTLYSASTGAENYLYNSTQQKDVHFSVGYNTSKGFQLASTNGDIAVNDIIVGYFSADAEIY